MLDCNEQRREVVEKLSLSDFRSFPFSLTVTTIVPLVDSSVPLVDSSTGTVRAKSFKKSQTSWRKLMME